MDEESPKSVSCISEHDQTVRQTVSQKLQTCVKIIDLNPDAGSGS